MTEEFRQRWHRNVKVGLCCGPSPGLAPGEQELLLSSRRCGSQPHTRFVGSFPGAKPPALPVCSDLLQVEDLPVLPCVPLMYILDK